MSDEIERNGEKLLKRLESAENLREQLRILDELIPYLEDVASLERERDLTPRAKEIVSKVVEKSADVLNAINDFIKKMWDECAAMETHTEGRRS